MLFRSIDRLIMAAAEGPQPVKSSRSLKPLKSLKDVRDMKDDNDNKELA